MPGNRYSSSLAHVRVVVGYPGHLGAERGGHSEIEAAVASREGTDRQAHSACSFLWRSQPVWMNFSSQYGR